MANINEFSHVKPDILGGIDKLSTDSVLPAKNNNWSVLWRDGWNRWRIGHKHGHKEPAIYTGEWSLLIGANIAVRTRDLVEQLQFTLQLDAV